MSAQPNTSPTARERLLVACDTDAVLPIASLRRRIIRGASASPRLRNLRG